MLYENYTKPINIPGRGECITVFVGDSTMVIPYSQFLIENRMGRHLQKDERINHKDGNTSNIDISNLEVISLKKKDSFTNVHKEQFTCPVCGKDFTATGVKLSHIMIGRKKGYGGPFCTNVCAGKYSSKMRLEKANASK